MQKVISRDGTSIAFKTIGAGPVLILIGGSLSDHQYYTPLADELSKDFTVYNYDRRGRGQSGYTGTYAVEREIEDLAALINHSGQPVFVYGHSAGSALALRAAASGLNIASMALSDPPYTPRGENDEAFKIEFRKEATRIQELHDQGNFRDSVKHFLGGMGLTDEDMEGILGSAAGEAMVKNARALPYDYALLGDGLVPVDLAAKVAIPALILAANPMSETARSLAKVMPNSQFQAMESSAHETPPDQIAELLTRFFLHA